MSSIDWPERFRDIYQRGLQRYREGNSEADGFFNCEDAEFLAGIGCTSQEMFDFVEDACNHDEPSFEAALLVQAERRDYFLAVQGGKSSGKVQSVESFPAKTDEVDGIAWLPRMTAKVRAKLQGELPPELMYG